MRVVAIFGGGGTGKTKKLTELYSEAVKEYGISKVAFVSYTRNQVGHDRTVARKDLKLKAKDMNFKTLHSTANKSYGGSREIIDDDMISRMSIFLGADMQSVARGIDFMKNTLTEDDAVGANRAGLEAKEFQKYKRFYESVKQGTAGGIDFADMLKDAVDAKFKVDCEAAFVDEAQDLSPLQWQAVYTFFRDAKVLYVAGDPNQSLYRFAGGASGYMLKMKCDETIILDKSYRCCDEVMLMAERVWGKIKDKAALPSSNGEEGFAVFYPDLNIRKAFWEPIRAVQQKNKSVLVLANTYYQLKQMKERLFAGREYPHNFFSGRCRYRWKNDGRHVITFSTVHQAKGLEADYVIYDSSCGQVGRVSDFGSEFEKEQDYWKTCYTAITRAKKGLVVCQLSSPKAGEPTCLDLLYYAKYGFDNYKRFCGLKPFSAQDSSR